ncbi:MAG: hypothetical protein FWD55_04110 [Propionibacteriaceae bacterium]|nr:hypothetical protein [Propionibacteriaceae bacterium]
MDESTLEEIDSVEQEELEALSPAPRSWTLITVVLLVCISLVIAWIAPRFAHPQLGFGVSANIGVMPGAPYALALVQVNQPNDSVVLLSVNDLTGVRVALSGVAHSQDEVAALESGWTQIVEEGCSAEPDCSIEPVSMVDRLIEASPAFQETQLPQSVSTGDSIWVLWEITACEPYGFDLNSSDESVTYIDPESGVKLRGLFGIPVTQHDTLIPNPFDYGVEWLEENGSCPT